MTNLNMTIISSGWRLCLEYPSSCFVGLSVILFVCLFVCLSSSFFGNGLIYAHETLRPSYIGSTPEAY